MKWEISYEDDVRIEEDWCHQSPEMRNNYIHADYTIAKSKKNRILLRRYESQVCVASSELAYYGEKNNQVIETSGQLRWLREDPIEVLELIDDFL